MTELLLELITSYGVLVIFLCCFLSCLLLPIPSSLLMLTGGAFVASGDLSGWQVAGGAWLGAVLGDQTGFRLGRFGTDPIDRLVARDPSRVRLVRRAEVLVGRQGGLGVFFSTWLFAPLGPWVNIIAGAARLGWLRFTLWDAAGEAIWVALYVGLGYAFAGQISMVADLAGSISGLIAAGAVTVLLGVYLFRAGGTHETGA